LTQNQLLQETLNAIFSLANMVFLFPIFRFGKRRLPVCRWSYDGTGVLDADRTRFAFGLLTSSGLHQRRISLTEKKSIANRLKTL